MNELSGKCILLGVTGGIAAYKSPDLVRRLRDEGADVRVVMTSGSQAFVTPLTFQATSGNPVYTELLDEEAEAGMGHIELARWADIILIAPASANRIAALAHGFADDLLTTLCLASEASLFLAPAMNQAMWRHEAVQANCDLLQQRGAVVLGPGSGEQACGDIGAGRMLEPLEIREQLIAQLTPVSSSALAGAHIVMTAGPTQEAIDPVRYISNHSSGKMGFAIATAAVKAGARVTLVSGPVNLSTPKGVDRIDVTNTQSMYDAVMNTIGSANIFIGVAAVADYRAKQAQPEKIKKFQDTMLIELQRNPDILATVAARDKKPFTVGFAAETNDVEHYAADKMQRKNLDMIAANHVGGDDCSFGSNDNALTVFFRNGEKQVLARASKTVLARQLIEQITYHYKA